jgi:tRNA/tmRNA/rRNA uracil-C5-methylase (TrmA/RlmC/RlmD family)
MHTNKINKKKNYLNQIKEIFWLVGLTTQDLFPTIFQAVPLHYRVRVGVQIDKGSLELLMFSTHEIKRVGWRQKG